MTTEDLMSLPEVQRAMYAERLGDLVGLNDDYYEGISFAEAFKLLLATEEQREMVYRWVRDEKGRAL